MKRDMDICREILLQIEEKPADYHPPIMLKLPEQSKEVVSEHVRLLAEACLIEAVSGSFKGGSDWQPTRLTWDGHDFIDAARDDGLWRKAKEATLKRAGGLAFDVLKSVLVELAKNAVLLR